jgi:ATP-dependent Clp protease protease subunit
MIHQPSGGAQGQATDILIQAENIQKTKETLNAILAHHTGKSVDVVTADTERDNFMDAKTALEYGLVDEILEKRKS